MTLEEAKEIYGEGWHHWLDEFYSYAEFLDKIYPVKIVKVFHRFGMFSVEVECQEETIQEILTLLSWAIERKSVWVCEICGRKGVRRRKLPGQPVRCGNHRIQTMNQMAEQGLI